VKEEEMSKILVVDDDPSVLALAKKVLTEAGCEVVVASDVGGAIDLLLEDDSFDLVVTDFLLPDGNGDSVAELAKNEYIPVLVMSGMQGKAFEESMLSIADSFIAKPFSPEDLSRAVRQLLDEIGEDCINNPDSAELSSFC